MKTKNLCPRRTCVSRPPASTASKIASMLSSIGGTKHAESWPRGPPPFIRVGNWEEIQGWSSGCRTLPRQRLYPCRAGNSNPAGQRHAPPSGNISSGVSIILPFLPFARYRRSSTVSAFLVSSMVKFPSQFYLLNRQHNNGYNRLYNCRKIVLYKVGFKNGGTIYCICRAAAYPSMIIHKNTLIFYIRTYEK